MLTFRCADQLSKKANLIFIPVLDGKVTAPEIEELFELNLQDELTFFIPAEKPSKAGETFDIPVSAAGYKCERLTFVSFGKSTPAELRAAGAAIGRKLRGKSDLAFLLLKLKS